MKSPSGKRSVRFDEAESPDAKKRATLWTAFADKIRDAPSWITNMKDGTWKNVTTGKSRRTLCVLQNSRGSDEFCMVGRVFGARLSEEALSEPQPFETSDEHTDLELHLSLRECNPTTRWPTVVSDMAAAQDVFCNMPEHAARGAFTPLIVDKANDGMVGLPKDRFARFRKHAKNPDRITESLIEQWGGKGTNQTSDIVRFKRRCYNENDLSNHRVFEERYLRVMDDRGEPISYMGDRSAIERGDIVLVWFRAITQCTAGNFHVSYEPKTVMRLAKGGSGGGGAAGSSAFAEAMAKAMQRDEQ